MCSADSTVAGPLEILFGQRGRGSAAPDRQALRFDSRRAPGAMVHPNGRILLAVSRTHRARGRALPAERTHLVSCFPLG